jgi:hypothetical protein
MARYRPLIAGIAVYFIAFAGLYAATKSLVIALALGAVFGGAAGLGVYSLFPADPELVDYQLDVRRRVRTVLKTTDQIADAGGKIKDPDSRNALLKGCEVIRDLLKLAQQKDPSNIAATTAKVGVYISSVKTAADAQLQIEAHPDYWTNADQLLAANREGFTDFKNFALGTVQQLNQGDVTSLRANLNMLKPMSTPALSATGS